MGEQLAAARAVGVTVVVQVGIDVPSSQLSAQIAAEHPDLWAAAAMHPNEAGAGAATPEALAEIERLAGLPQVVAVGETGLDHYRTPSEGQAQQEESFRAHIDIAKRTGTTLVIHDRDAHDDVLRVLAEEGAPERVVFHCFSGDEAMARVCAEQGYFLSFAGNITFKNAGDLRAAAGGHPARAAAGRDGRALPHPDAVARPTQRVVPHPGHDAGARRAAGRRPRRALRAGDGQRPPRLRPLTEAAGRSADDDGPEVDPLAALDDEPTADADAGRPGDRQ